MNPNLTSMVDDILQLLCKYLIQEEKLLLYITHRRFQFLKNEYGNMRHIGIEYALCKKNINLIKLVQCKKYININKYFLDILYTHDLSIISHLINPIKDTDLIVNKIDIILKKSDMDTIIYLFGTIPSKRVIDEIVVERFDVLKKYMEMGIIGEIDTDTISDLCMKAINADSLKLLWNDKIIIGVDCVEYAITKYCLEDLKWVFDRCSNHVQHAAAYRSSRSQKPIPIENAMWLYETHALEACSTWTITQINKLNCRLHLTENIHKIDDAILVYQASKNIFFEIYDITSLECIVHIMYYAKLYNNNKVCDHLEQKLYDANMSFYAILAKHVSLEDLRKLVYVDNLKTLNKTGVFIMLNRDVIIKYFKRVNMLELISDTDHIRFETLMYLYEPEFTDPFYYVVNNKNITFLKRLDRKMSRIVCNSNDIRLLEIAKSMGVIHDKYVCTNCNLDLIKYFEIEDIDLFLQYGNNEIVDYGLKYYSHNINHYSLYYAFRNSVLLANKLFNESYDFDMFYAKTNSSSDKFPHDIEFYNWVISKKPRITELSLTYIIEQDNVIYYKHYLSEKKIVYDKIKQILKNKSVSPKIANYIKSLQKNIK